MSASSQLFLVIGAGPVGLAMAKALGEQGVPYLQVEATDHVGGNWAHGVYKTAHIISSRSTTEFPDYPMPSSFPDFPSGAQMCQYYNDFADEFSLRDHIRFSCPVTSVERSGPLWRVTFADGTTERFKGVYVCNGHHWKKNFPGWVSDFSGEVLHAKDYKTPDQLRGKRVLVIGGGNSGCDLSSEAARVGVAADWSTRRGYWILPKTFLGRPTIEFVHPMIPVFLQRLFVKMVVRLMVGRYEDYGLKYPDHKPFERHPTVNSEVFHYLKHGTLHTRPDVASVSGNAVTFSDGTTAEYDVVACATGYDVAFPFLPDGMVQTHRRVAQLIGGALIPGLRNLYIVGAYQPRYGIGPVVRPYCQALARWALLQDDLQTPIADVLVSLGQKAPQSEVVDPHESIRMANRTSWLNHVIRWKGRQMDRRSLRAAVVDA